MSGFVTHFFIWAWTDFNFNSVIKNNRFEFILYKGLISFCSKEIYGGKCRVGLGF